MTFSWGGANSGTRMQEGYQLRRGQDGALSCTMGVLSMDTFGRKKERTDTVKKTYKESSKT